MFGFESWDLLSIFDMGLVFFFLALGIAVNWGFSLTVLGFTRFVNFGFFLFIVLGIGGFFLLLLLWGGEILRSGVCDIHCMLFQSVFHFMLV